MVLTQAKFTDTACQPLLKWPGGKRSELSWIKPLVPFHNRYIEPFFGGGSVFFSSINVPTFANDLHPDLMSFYACVQERRTIFFDLLSDFVNEWESGTLAHREAMYYRSRDRYNASVTFTDRRTADFFMLRQLAYGGMFRVNSEGSFNVPFGKAYGRSDRGLRKKVEYLRTPAVQAKMRLLTLSTLDFEQLLRDVDIRADDFVFLDPPYDTSFSKYHSDFTELDQERLAACLENLTGKFMLVSKLTPLIERLYCSNGYNVRQYDFGYKFNIKGRFSRSSTHILVTNYGADL